MAGALDIVSELHHFALVTYALPAERLRPHIPSRFEIPEFSIEGRPLALMSAVPFVDVHFRFRWLPFARFRFCQTNYRVYVIDRETDQHAVWFFGTTLGSWTVHVARWLWRIPWYPARYDFDCHYDDGAARYREFRYRARSAWAEADIALRDTGEPVTALAGFQSSEDMTLILTHPVDGYFYRLDGSIGTYSVSHDVIALTRAEPVRLHFSLFERLGLLSPEEMSAPHSALVCRQTVFHIHMPPRRA